MVFIAAFSVGILMFATVTTALINLATKKRVLSELMQSLAGIMFMSAGTGWVIYVYPETAKIVAYAYIGGAVASTAFFTLAGLIHLVRKTQKLRSDENRNVKFVLRTE